MQVRLKILESNGIYGLRMMKKELLGSGMPAEVNEREFVHFLSHFGIRLSDKELAAIMTTFDPSGNHVVSVHSVLQALRVNLTTARRALVEQVFDNVSNGNSSVALMDLQGCFDPSGMDAVWDGEITNEQARDDFLVTWDQLPGEAIAKAAFVEYYKDVSAIIEDDTDFNMMLRSTWHNQDTLNLTNNGLQSFEVRVLHRDGHESIEYIAWDLGISPWDDTALKAFLKRNGHSPVTVVPLVDSRND